MDWTREWRSDRALVTFFLIGDIYMRDAGYAEESRLKRTKMIRYIMSVVQCHDAEKGEKRWNVIRVQNEFLNVGH